MSFYKKNQEDENTIGGLHADGKAPVAMLDRCPHRAAALSEGRMTASGDLQCAYHGWTFGADGACLDIPQARPLILPATETPIHVLVLIHVPVAVLTHMPVRLYVLLSRKFQ